MADAAAPFDVDSLPPTQYLILEVLAARHRLGERYWTFANRCRSAARALERSGLVWLRSSPAPRCFEARFTEAGMRAALLDSYVPPRDREPVRVIVVLNKRRGTVHAVTCDQTEAQQMTRELIAKYDGDPLAASMTVGLVTPATEA